ncbi:unnamed protein product [Rotaria sp. Silwood1]|nr:unnamed protein product [Rotaria sp. Silwood1]CAF3529877.1 unnamed protein product [Rotaria sp. Silwood1]CAF3587844.1 unnamed protein product [Rotaria sp. Silwood1]CAF3680627.1 unnamed protein product [Rotaria sp. Silwood1]CAF4819670.1 unnamed protein product [Rotaria sp. Silwood1]
MFEENVEHLPTSYGLIVLNYSKPSIDKWLTESVWSRAKIRACADGGSNELRQFTLEKTEQRLGRFTPDFISGDFDSIKPETQQLYEEEFKVPLIETKDQDATDFTKCLEELLKRMDGESLKEIYVFCTFAGRFDQAMSIIHTLYLYPKLNIFLISDQDVTFLLKPGLNRVHQIRSPLCGTYCSLIPFAGALKVITNGLQWNLNEKMELNYSKLISTSNAYSEPKSDFVTINTPEPLVWSMTFAETVQTEQKSSLAQ